MGRSKKSTSGKLRALAVEFKEDSLEYENNTLSCLCCGVRLGMDSDSEVRRFITVQHLGTPKHKNAIELYNSQQKLNFEKDTFSLDICQAFVAADIPIYKLNHPVLRECWEKYCGRKLPDQSTIRKNYLNETFEATMECIRQEIGDSNIWVSIDETTDSMGRYIANVIIGKLNGTESGRPLLLNVVQLQKANFQTIAALFNDSMSLLWPRSVDHSKVLLFISDAAPYMVKAGKTLKTFYHRMSHITCLAHGLHRIAEAVRTKYKVVDKFIGSMKKIFLKAPARVTAFKEQFPDLSLPPKPVLTRWGTWLTTVSYYADNLNKIAQFVLSLNDDDSSAVREVQTLLEKKRAKLTMDITEIQQYYAGIADTITQLETKGQPLVRSLELWQDAIDMLCNSPHQVIAEKALSVLNKNRDLPKIVKLSRNDPSLLDQLPFTDMSPTELASFRFAPVVSVDVERSFSTLKSVLRDNRKSFLIENLKEHLIIGCYTNV
ncbi:uncharacterized protein LOC135842640 [Planococcus citri]|uniref:uncharacterized protein LOC135841405 n=1 Tax=Planococcus citri TaxID=170843 RepID=UPI0031F97FDF